MINHIDKHEAENVTNGVLCCTSNNVSQEQAISIENHHKSNKLLIFSVNSPLMLLLLSFTYQYTLTTVHEDKADINPSITHDILFSSQSITFHWDFSNQSSVYLFSAIVLQGGSKNTINIKIDKIHKIFN